MQHMFECMQTQGLVENLATASLNAANGGLVRSVLACGFYPQVGRLLPPKGNQGGPHSKAVILTARDEKVGITKRHPQHAVQTCCLSVTCLLVFP